MFRQVFDRLPPLGVIAVVAGAASMYVFLNGLSLLRSAAENNILLLDETTTYTVSLGSGLLIVAATLGGVQATLSREDRRQREWQYERLQLDLMDRAHRWASEVSHRVWRVAGLVIEAGHARTSDRQTLLLEAEKEAERFYTSGVQRLDEAAFLTKALDDTIAAEAVGEIDVSLRRLNETLAGDDSEPHVNLVEQTADTGNAVVDAGSAISRQAETLATRHAEWVRDRYQRR